MVETSSPAAVAAEHAATVHEIRFLCQELWAAVEESNELPYIRNHIVYYLSPLQ